MLPEPPFPIAASFNAPGPTIVVFSTFLTPGPLDLANWSVVFNNILYTITNAEIIPAYPNPTVHLTRAVSQLQIGPNVVNYLPPPFDVTSRIGDIPAPAFAGFPLGP